MLSKTVKLLKSEDTYGFLSEIKTPDSNTSRQYLNGRLNYLARTLQIAQNHNINLKGMNLFEFGANCGNLKASAESPYNSGILHFFVLHGKKIGVNYHCNDFEFEYFRNRQDLEEARANLFERWDFNKNDAHPIYRLSKEKINELVEGIYDVYRPYRDISDMIADCANSKNKPVVFSNFVFGAEADYSPFWKLSGCLHIHQYDLNEDKSRESILKSLEIELDDHESAFYLLSETIRENPKMFYDKFRNSYGIDADLNHIHPNGDRIITVYWTN